VSIVPTTKGDFNTEGTENAEIRRENPESEERARFLLFSVPLCVLSVEFS
jgi:hypothetical protein